MIEGWKEVETEEGYLPLASPLPATRRKYTGNQAV